jgi:hypothetical protein
MYDFEHRDFAFVADERGGVGGSRRRACPTVIPTVIGNVFENLASCMISFLGQTR